MTVKGLKRLLEDLPDDAQVLIQDPFSEYAYNSIGADRCRAKVERDFDEGCKWYDALTSDSVSDFIEDMAEDEKEQFFKEYTPTIIFYDLTYAGQ